MPHRRPAVTIAAAIALVLFGLAPSIASAEPLGFRVWLDATAAEEPISGRLFVFLSRSARGEPRFGPNWFRPEPFFGRDVAAFEPGTSCTIDDGADGFPDRLSRLPPGRYRAQAVLHHSFYSASPGRGEGNSYSDAVWVDVNPNAGRTFELVLRHVVPAQPFRQSAWVKEVAVRSELLSQFHGREVIERAAVVLPPSYDREPDRRYPAAYVVPGFGGSYRSAPRMRRTGPGPGEVEFIRVMLDGQCQWGHHVYANSETNGPRGDALVRELIPHVDRRYRTVAAPTARFVTGHSSGGWSSLWLQVSYPDVFGGVWSSAPDPVDFRTFQGIDLYADPPRNMYRDEQGNRRPIARRGTRPVLWYDSFTRMDDCLGRGGQLRSFEAVFSPRGPDGLPRKLWDRATGRIDPEVARAWRKYDICALLADDWDTLGPELRGKLHVVVGELDTFYLESAVHGLDRTLQQLGSDAQIEFLPGRDHGSVLAADPWRKRWREMSEVFVKQHGARSGVAADESRSNRVPREAPAGYAAQVGAAIP